MHVSPHIRRVAILSKAVLLLLLLLGVGVLCFVHVCGLALLVLSSVAFRLQRKRKLFNLPLLFLTVSVMGLFVVVPWVGLRYVTMTFPGHTHLHFKIHLRSNSEKEGNLKVSCVDTDGKTGCPDRPSKSQSYLFTRLYNYVPPS